MTANIPIDNSMPKVSATIVTTNLVDPTMRQNVSIMTVKRIAETDALLAMKDGRN